MPVALPITPALLAVARGDAPADLLLADARVVDVFTRRIEGPTSVAIADGRIAGIGQDYTRAVRTIRLGGAFVAPGFIDAHMHVESAMLPPSQFVRLAVPHGTTGVVLDPHEIANVLGLDGIRLLMEDAEDLPIHAWFAVSSCVPSSPLETSGATLDAADLSPLFDDERLGPRIAALAEMMNFPGVIRGDDKVIEKVNLGLSRRMVDGHAPGVRGRDLNAYLAAGITSDHECTTAEEASEKLARGMRIFIREGSAARNLDALLPLVTPATAHRFCFCTDDRHPADLRGEGHIDHVIRRAIAGGLDAPTAIAIASINTAEHYRLPQVGAVAPGYRADMVVFDDPGDVRPRQVYFGGALVAEEGRFLGPQRPAARVARGALRLPPGLSEASFAIPAGRGAGRVRVIGMNPQQLVTESLVMEGTVRNGQYVADPSRDVLKLAVIERHRGAGGIGLGFVKGFGFARGAIASTVGHDAHNLAVVGADDGDMLAAARAVADAGGGQCAVLGGRVLALLPLPIAGLMSDRPAETVIAQQAALLAATGDGGLGCPLRDPFMPLSFLSLPVIPHLKLTDQGLVDVDRFRVVPIEV
jgi:adenine deaminase